MYTRRDPVLAQVMELVQTGWEEPVNTPEIAPYAHRRDKITVHQGQILMWGNRVIVPRKLQDRVRETIHEGHLGVGKMKDLARGYVWWPNLDKDIECAARNCDGCQELGKNPASTPLHRWEFPAQPWQRLHVDFAGPIQGKMILVCTDAHSKWPEVVVMKNTSVEETVATLRSIFARIGFPGANGHRQWTTVHFARVQEVHKYEWRTTCDWGPLPPLHKWYGREVSTELQACGEG